MVNDLLLENVFRELLGVRHPDLAKLVEAASLRRGRPDDLGRLLQASAVHLRSRMRVLAGGAELMEGSPVSRLLLSADRLEEFGQRVSEQTEREPLDHRWGLIATLLRMVSALLDHAEAAKQA